MLLELFYYSLAFIGLAMQHNWVETQLSQEHFESCLRCFIVTVNNKYFVCPLFLRRC